jgi:CBS domain-containing membrane protein
LGEIHGYVDITPLDFKAVYRLAVRHAVERLRHFLKAGDIMTKDVIAVTRETTILEVAELMEQRGISGVPVIDEGEKVVGMVSEKDLLHLLSSPEATTVMRIITQSLRLGTFEIPSLVAQKAGDIMTSPALTVQEDTPVLEIKNPFSEKKINRAPVVDEEGRLVGIVSRDDIVRSSALNLNNYKQ